MRRGPRQGRDDEHQPHLLVGDAERSATVDQLREHYIAGRLTHDWFCERLEGALRAATRGDLDRLLADLPAPAGSRGGRRGAVGRVGRRRVGLAAAVERPAAAAARRRGTPSLRVRVAAGIAAVAAGAGAFSLVGGDLGETSSASASVRGWDPAAICFDETHVDEAGAGCPGESAEQTALRRAAMAAGASAAESYVLAETTYFGDSAVLAASDAASAAAADAAAAVEQARAALAAAPGSPTTDAQVEDLARRARAAADRADAALLRAQQEADETYP